MSEHITPISAWCPVDQAGVLQVQHIQFYRNHIMVPAGKDWRIVRVVVDSRDAWEAREEARKAIDDLPDTVACALLGGQRDEWAMED